MNALEERQCEVAHSLLALAADIADPCGVYRH
jgi:hypothetical protein